MKGLSRIIYFFVGYLFLSSPVFGQTQDDIDRQLERVRGEGILNTITTAVPFLMISPDSRAGGMGDVGVATSPDAFSSHWNTSKLAFVENNMGVSLSYVPWLQSLVPDINMSYLSGYSRINDQAVVSGSLRYFTLGEINLTDEGGNQFQTITPNELAVDVGIAYKLSELFAGGFSLRYMYSDLTRGVSIGGQESSPASAIAADLNGYYQKEITVGEYDADLTFGFNLSNMGNKVSYSEAADRDFIPINLRIGSGLNLKLDDYNSLGFYVDVNKLMVPTPPVILNDEEGQAVRDETGEFVLLSGRNPDVSVPVGMIQSFYDAPGGFREELNEYVWSVGTEYWYDNQFAARAGFLYEHPNKGNRQYFTVGAGVKWEMLIIDFSYLVPINQRNPLENTVRFSLGIDFAALNKKPETEN